MEPQTRELQHNFTAAGEDKMRIPLTVTSITELTLITVLSGSAIYAFISSSIYDHFYDLVRALTAAINLPIMYYLPLPLILWGLVFAFGVLSITFSGGSSGEFVWLVTLLSLPSLLSYNTVNYVGFTYPLMSHFTPLIGYNAVRWLAATLGLAFNLTTTLSFAAMLGLGVLTITGYVVLNHLHIIKQARHNLTNRGADPVDIARVTSYSYLVLILAIAGALITAAAIVFLSGNLELFILDHIRDMPWNVVFIGLLCILLLAGYLYWLGAKRRSKHQSSG